MATCFPAEWHKQSAVMLAWPHADTDWSDQLTSAEQIYIQLVCAISPYQSLLILCKDSQHQTHISQQLKKHAVNSNVIFHIAPFNDTWTRDYGPVSITRDGKPGLLNFQFNGWGNKFEFKLDNKINTKLTTDGVWQPAFFNDIPFVLEGGSIDSNGTGAILTTSACLLNKNRSDNRNKQVLKQLLKDTLGVNQIYWLDHGYLSGDDTDSHIDTLARFTDEKSIAYMSCDDEGDEHYEALKQMEAELRQFRNKIGEPFRLFPINIPSPIHDENGNRLPASYVNFLFTNGPVLLPVYGDKTADTRAYAQLKLALPDKQIVMIDCKALILQHGSLHCITMQILEGIL